DLRDHTSGKPGSALSGGAATQVTMSAGGWMIATGFTAALTAGTHYWATVGDDNFSSGAHTIQYGSLVGLNSTDFFSNVQLLLCATTTNTWTTTTYQTSKAPNIILVCASGRNYGNPYISSSSPSSSAESRGLRINDGLSEKINVYGATWSN